MTKRDYVWVGVRIFGLYLLVQAVISLATEVGSHVASQQARVLLDSQNENVARAAAADMVRWQGFFWVAAVKLGAYGLAAYYFLRRGQGLIDWIAPPSE